MPEGYNRRMLSQYHIEIMLASLGGRFSPRAMSVITHANINQDRIAGQFGHDEYHFDNNAFDKSYAYIEEQRAFAISSLRSGNADALNDRDLLQSNMKFPAATFLLTDKGVAVAVQLSGATVEPAGPRNYR